MRYPILNGKSRALCLCLLTFLLGFSIPAFGQEFEYKVKAEFIERFTRFIDWPPGSVPDSTVSFEICVIGKNPFGEYLNDLARVVKIKGKSVRIRNVENPAQLNGCNVLFIAASESTNIPQILEKTSDQPILTIGDTPGFAEKGVLINFYRSANYVRFEINNGAAQKSGLRFSSRLLKLGRLVDTTNVPENSR